MIKKHAPFELEDNCEFFVKHIFFMRVTLTHSSIF
jgi:hypothetical protein